MKTTSQVSNVLICTPEISGDDEIKKQAADTNNQAEAITGNQSQMTVRKEGSPAASDHMIVNYSQFFVGLS